VTEVRSTLVQWPLEVDARNAERVSLPRRNLGIGSAPVVKRVVWLDDESRLGSAAARMSMAFGRMSATASRIDVHDWWRLGL
jgi:hypothetical protein